MRQVFQETLGGENEKVVSKKGGWGRLHPHFAAASPYPTPGEIKRGEIRWSNLARMAAIVRALDNGDRPEAERLATEAHPQRRMPGF